MIDERLVGTIVGYLKRSGLPEVSSEGTSGGGFAVQPDQDIIYVVWSPSDELSVEVFDHLARGNVADPAVLQAGVAKHAMAKAMLEILLSAGFDAQMSADDMSPATIEIRTT